MRSPHGADQRIQSLKSAHEATVTRYVMRRVRQSECGEVIGDVFAIAWRRINDIPVGDERAWLLGVARRVVLNYWRSERRRSALSLRLGRVRAALALPEDEVAIGHAIERNARLGQVLRGLSPEDREVLLLVAWEELDSREISEVLSISHAAARQRLSRARSRARDLYVTPDLERRIDPSYDMREYPTP